MACAFVLVAGAAAAAAPPPPPPAVRFTVGPPEQATPWAHHWEESVGSGHALLTTRADWRAHLARCARDLGVKRTRFHGLLDDDFDISLGEGQDNYVNLDSLVDFSASVGVEPLFEVSFTPSWLAVNASQTNMHYKGISSPPKDMSKWGDVIGRMVSHLAERYPASEFMFEVWNEPNGGFFTPPNAKSDKNKQAAYFELYAVTANAIKNASNGRFKVGGPATAGCPGWTSELVAFSKANGTALDFVSCHVYGGGADEPSSGNIGGVVGPLPSTKSDAAGLPVVITEWSSSWMYTNGYHDDVASAPFIVAAVAEMDGLVNVTSYWTFSDVFEEGTLLPVPFHGGFGLLTVHGTPKPAYRAFELLHGTGNQRLPVSKPPGTAGAGRGGLCDSAAGVLVTTLANATGVRVFAWNHPPTFSAKNSSCAVTIDGIPAGAATATRIDASHTNPRAAWTSMGSPTYPTAAQLAALEAASELAWADASGVVRNGVATLALAPDTLVVIDVKATAS